MLLRQAYVIMSRGPRKGWNFAEDVNMRISTNIEVARSVAPTSIIESAGIQTKPQVEHPPGDCPTRHNGW